jgi:hypothetical protein
VKPTHVDVTPVKVPFVAWRFVAFRFVMVPVVAWMSVEKKFVVVAFVAWRFTNVPVVATKFDTVPLEAKKFVVVTFVAFKLEVVTEAKMPFQRRDAEPRDRLASRDGMRSVTTREVTPKKEVVAAEKEAFVPVRFVKMPFEANRFEEVTEPMNTKSPVEVPPANWMAFVVVLPAFVTVWRFGVVPLGQLVPFERQMLWPFT